MIVFSLLHLTYLYTYSSPVVEIILNLPTLLLPAIIPVIHQCMTAGLRGYGLETVTLAGDGDSAVPVMFMFCILKLSDKSKGKDRNIINIMVTVRT